LELESTIDRRQPIGVLIIAEVLIEQIDECRMVELAHEWDYQKRFNVDWKRLSEVQLYTQNGVPVTFQDLYRRKVSLEHNQSIEFHLLVFLNDCTKSQLCRSLKYIQFIQEITEKSTIAFLFDGTRCEMDTVNQFVNDLKWFNQDTDNNLHSDSDLIKFCVDSNGTLFKEFLLKNKRTSFSVVKSSSLTTKRIPKIPQPSSKIIPSSQMPPELPVLLLKSNNLEMHFRPTIQYAFCMKNDFSDTSQLITRLFTELGLTCEHVTLSQDSFFMNEFLERKQHDSSLLSSRNSSVRRSSSLIFRSSMLKRNPSSSGSKTLFRDMSLRSRSFDPKYHSFSRKTTVAEEYYSKSRLDRNQTGS